jgi:site-specific DNA-methyltransferase (adenine-specific)
MLPSGFYNMDCLEAMREFPDKFFELALVDPPYGLDRMSKGTAENNRTGFAHGIWNDTKPTQEYFDELFRVSKHAIIWGANNFTLPSTEYFIIWDKFQTVDNFASAEFAWTNCAIPARVFRYAAHQMMQDRKKEGGKIPPTQKPIALYTWLLQNYAHHGDKILDTHVGSASSLIACHRMGFEFWGFELDESYYKSASERLEKEKAQQTLFSTEEIYKPQQQGLEFDE